MSKANSESAFENAADIFKEIPDYEDSLQKEAECRLLAANIEKEKIYKKGIAFLTTSKVVRGIDSAIGFFEQIPDYKDSKEKIKECKEKIEAIKQKEKKKEKFKEKEEKNSETEKKERRIKRRKRFEIFLIIVAIIAGFVILCGKPILYSAANYCYDNHKYTRAISIYSRLDDYKDSNDLETEARYKKGKAEFKKKHYATAKLTFKKIESYKDSYKYRLYSIAMVSIENNKMGKAYADLHELGTFNKANEFIENDETLSQYKKFVHTSWKCDKYGFILSINDFGTANIVYLNDDVRTSRINNSNGIFSFEVGSDIYNFEVSDIKAKTLKMSSKSGKIFDLKKIAYVDCGNNN